MNKRMLIAVTSLAVAGVAVLATIWAIAPIPARAAGIITVDQSNPSCVSSSGQADPYSEVYCNIVAAADDSSDGDTIQIAAGTYVENPFIDTEVTLQGAGAGSTIIDGSGWANTVLTLQSTAA